MGVKHLATVAVLALGSVWSVAPAWAHHSFAAEFDADQPVTLKGTVQRIDFVNPHAWLYIDVTDENGHTERWNVEMGSPNSLIRRGITKDFVPVGSEVTVQGYRARDGSNTANSQSVTLPDGRGLYTGSSGTGAPGGPTRINP